MCRGGVSPPCNNYRKLFLRITILDIRKHLVYPEGAGIRLVTD